MKLLVKQASKKHKAHLIVKILLNYKQRENNEKQKLQNKNPMLLIHKIQMKLKNCLKYSWKQISKMFLWLNNFYSEILNNL